jgi:hypothetical protein
VPVGEHLGIEVETDIPDAEFHTNVTVAVRNEDQQAADILIDDSRGEPRQPFHIMPQVMSLWSWSAVRPGVAIVEFRDAQGTVTGTLRVTVLDHRPAPVIEQR